MKKILKIFLFILIATTFFTNCFSSANSISDGKTNINSSVYSDSNDLMVDINEGYTNDLIYNENYDYTLGYDEEDNFESMSLEGKVIEASSAFVYDNGYIQSLAQNLKVEITDSRHNGEEYDIIYYLEDDYNTRLPQYQNLKVGDKVYVYANFVEGKLDGDAFIQYYDKTNWIILLSVIVASLILLIASVPLI